MAILRRLWLCLLAKVCSTWVPNGDVCRNLRISVKIPCASIGRLTKRHAAGSSGPGPRLIEQKHPFCSPPTYACDCGKGPGCPLCRSLWTARAARGAHAVAHNPDYPCPMEKSFPSESLSLPGHRVGAGTHPQVHDRYARGCKDLVCSQSRLYSVGFQALLSFTHKVNSTEE